MDAGYTDIGVYIRPRVAVFRELWYSRDMQEHIKICYDSDAPPGCVPA